MNKEDLRNIDHLDGIEFAMALLDYEQRRFAEWCTPSQSAFVEMNADFGPFPAARAAPVYFAGDIRRPDEKIVFIGINPGYNADKYKSELEFLESRGWFEGYCRLYGDYFQGKRISYYANIWGFLRRLYGFAPAKMDWAWYQEHFVALEMIPYHAENIKGLRINDRSKYREVYLTVLLKLLSLFPQQTPIFLNGFPTIRQFLAKDGQPYPEFADVIEFKQHQFVATGRIGGHEFVGLPFLNRPKGGKDAIVEEIRSHKGEQSLAWTPD
jgi:hypothetical protein